MIINVLFDVQALVAQGDASSKQVVMQL